MAIDWKLYERDVNRWYLEEGKTANEVIQLLFENHKLVVTPRQFKAKFGGCKKISSKEWSILIPKLREREANHLKSVVYVCGKAIKQESVTRSMRRYSKFCKDCSQSDISIDLGIDTIGQHRIEIRAPLEPRTQLRWDLSTDMIQPGREGENSSSSQSDELDVDEDFGLAEMDVEPSVPASAETVIYPSPSMFLGSLGQFPPDLLESLSFDGTHEMQMESDETQWLPLSPSFDITTLFPIQHTFTSFWNSPDILGLTLKSCEAAVDVAKRIGIFVPDHSRHKFLPGLNIGPSQTETFKPIIQSIEELLAPPKSKIQGASRTRLEDRAQLNFSPNLLDIIEGHSLAQALSVIVYMISNNLLDEEESFLLICWILKRGHAPDLLVFSRLPAVNHLAFGSAFLRAIAKSADKLLTINSEAIGLIGDFVSSSGFLSLVTSHREDIPGLLGTMLFRLATKVDSMELAKLLVSNRVNLNADSASRRDPYHNTGLHHVIHWRRHSMLESIISLGVGVDQSFFGSLALQEAIALGDHVAARILLDAGARILDRILFSPVSHRSPKTRALLREFLWDKRRDSRFVCCELLFAAQKGNRELSKVSLANDIVTPQVLEQAMCRAIESYHLAATRTFLQRRADPNVGMLAVRKLLSPPELFLNSSLPDIIHLLVQAGAQVSDETALSVRRFLDASHVDRFGRPRRLLRVLLEAGYDEAWVHQYLLTYSAEEGSIFECDACIDSGTPINGYGLRGHSALSIAAGRGHLALVQHLISRGAAPNLPPNSDHTYGESALYAALARGHWEVAAYLIESGSDVTTRATTGGATFLEGVVFKIRSIAQNSKVDVNTHFQNLLALGAPVNRLNSTASFLIHGLLDFDQLDCLELALQAGARTEDKYVGMTPIQLAALTKDSGAVQLLLQHGANIDGCHRPISNNTPIPEMPSPDPPRRFNDHNFEHTLEGTLFRHSSSSGFLMGFFAEKEPYFPHTPLQLASSANNPDLGFVKFLLSQGADINTPAAEWHGRTALQGAISAEKLNMDIVQLLLDRGADVNAPPARVGGVTALQSAAIRGDIQLVRFLLEKGADINAPGAPDEGRTALEGAAEHGRMEMLRFLLSKRAMPDFITGYSRAIRLAEKEMHVGIAKFLREEQRKLHRMGWGYGSLEFDLQCL